MIIAKNHRRKIACHSLFVGNMQYAMMVVHLQDGFVSYISYLDGEEPSTEWLPGTIRIERDTNGRWIASYRGNRLC